MPTLQVKQKKNASENVANPLKTVNSADDVKQETTCRFKPDTEQKTPERSHSELIYAAKIGNVQMIRYLLSEKESASFINKTDGNGKNALDYAAAEGNISAVKELIWHGAKGNSYRSLNLNNYKDTLTFPIKARLHPRPGDLHTALLIGDESKAIDALKALETDHREATDRYLRAAEIIWNALKENAETERLKQANGHGSHQTELDSNTLLNREKKFRSALEKYLDTARSLNGIYGREKLRACHEKLMNVLQDCGLGDLDHQLALNCDGKIAYVLGDYGIIDQKQLASIRESCRTLTEYDQHESRRPACGDDKGPYGTPLVMAVKHCPQMVPALLKARSAANRLERNDTNSAVGNANSEKDRYLALLNQLHSEQINGTDNPLDDTERGDHMALFYAIECGDLDTAAVLMENSEYIGPTEGCELTDQAPLTSAILCCKNESALRSVLKDGNSLSHHHPYLAARFNHVALSALINNGLDVNQKKHKGSLLFEAVQSENIESVKRLLQAGAGHKEQNSRDHLPISFASKLKDPVFIQMLIAAGADIESTDQCYKTPLMIAAAEGNTAVARELIRLGAALESVGTDNRTPLLYAAEGKDPETLEVLIEAGADTEATTLSGDTALMLAAQKRDSDILEVLIKAGADITARSKSGSTALESASYLENFDAMKKLIELGADPNGHSPGLSILQKIVQSGNNDLMNLLIEHGADPNSAGPAGRTALMDATKHQDLTILQQLIEAGANLDAVDDDGNTALVYAIKNRNPNALQALLEASADPRMVYNNDNLALIHSVQEDCPATTVRYIKENRNYLIDFTDTNLSLEALERLSMQEVAELLKNDRTPMSDTVTKWIDRQIEDNQKHSPNYKLWLFAMLHGRTDCARLLEEQGCLSDIDIREVCDFFITSLVAVRNSTNGSDSLKYYGLATENTLNAIEHLAELLSTCEQEEKLAYYGKLLAIAASVKNPDDIDSTRQRALAFGRQMIDAGCKLDETLPDSNTTALDESLKAYFEEFNDLLLENGVYPEYISKDVLDELMHAVKNGQLAECIEKEITNTNNNSPEEPTCFSRGWLTGTLKQLKNLSEPQPDKPLAFPPADYMKSLALQNIYDLYLCKKNADPKSQQESEILGNFNKGALIPYAIYMAINSKRCDYKDCEKADITLLLNKYFELAEEISSILRKTGTEQNDNNKSPIKLGQHIANTIFKDPNYLPIKQNINMNAQHTARKLNRSYNIYHPPHDNSVFVIQDVIARDKPTWMLGFAINAAVAAERLDLLKEGGITQALEKKIVNTTNPKERNDLTNMIYKIENQTD